MIILGLQDESEISHHYEPSLQVFSHPEYCATTTAYFQGLVSPIVLKAARKKQAKKNRTWFTLTVEGHNAVFYQVITSLNVILLFNFLIRNSWN